MSEARWQRRGEQIHPCQNFETEKINSLQEGEQISALTKVNINGVQLGVFLVAGSPVNLVSFEVTANSTGLLSCPNGSVDENWSFVIPYEVTHTVVFQECSLKKKTEDKNRFQDKIYVGRRRLQSIESSLSFQQVHTMEKTSILTIFFFLRGSIGFAAVGSHGSQKIALWCRGSQRWTHTFKR